MNLTQSPAEAPLMVSCELAHRSIGGVDVQLLWSRVYNQVAIVYTDLREERSFTVVVPNDRALDAFVHPNAYRPEPRSPDRQHRRPVHLAGA